jgi:hypothetical protein
VIQDLRGILRSVSTANVTVPHSCNASVQRATSKSDLSCPYGHRTPSSLSCSCAIQDSFTSIPSQKHIHGCVVPAAAAALLPCKRAGRRPSSGISFRDAVSQSQLSYQKSTTLCRLLEAFGTFGCRSLIESSIVREATKVWIVGHRSRRRPPSTVTFYTFVRSTYCKLLEQGQGRHTENFQGSPPAALSLPLVRCNSHAICISHTAAKRLRTSSRYSGLGMAETKRAPRMRRSVKVAESCASSGTSPSASVRPSTAGPIRTGRATDCLT